MKQGKILKIIFLFIFMINISLLFGQEDGISKCKVLLGSISESYQGGCKEGLANGKGIANGIDVYEGKFKNGLPHGTGKYTWANGDYYVGNWKEGLRNGKGEQFTVNTGKKIKGIWKNGEFIKEIKDPDYKVLLARGVADVSISEKVGGVPGNIEFVFFRDGITRSAVDNLSIEGNSGISQVTTSIKEFNNVAFPFEGIVNFVAPNRYNTATTDCSVRFLINNPGSWKVTIKF